jgi:Skp family chaperone for outer membrane proteins
MKLRFGKWDWLGWSIALALTSLAVAGGFQGPTEKIAVVDIVKVAEGSNLGKARQDLFAKQKKARETLVQFIDKKVISPEQLGRIRQLSLKDTLTPAETTELAKLKDDVTATTKRYSDLQGKPNLTPEEKLALQDYSRFAQNTDTAVNQWFQEFAGEMQAMYNQQRESVLDAARVAAKQVGKSQGFSIVFDANAAPYGVNDITDATLQAINKSP